MKILWFTWKDMKHPHAGGAEVVSDQICKRLTDSGHEVVLLTARYAGSSPEEQYNGYKIIRAGGRWSVYLQARKYYKKYLVGWPDLIIEEINTVPFFTSFYAKEQKFLFFHQLCREIWYYQMFFPLSLIGYLLEPIYLWLLRKNKVITISESSCNDLIRYGFKKEKIEIISEGIELNPITGIDIEKYSTKTMLSLGAIRPMKRTIDQIRAFEIAKKSIPELKLIIGGSGWGSYFEKEKTLIRKSRYASDIEYLGRVSKEKKIELMQKCHFITVTSVKEGWGLIVTEANSQGSPAVVYNVDGLRDSVKDGVTGLIATANNPKSLSKQIVRLCQDKELYNKLRVAAWDFSKHVTFENMFKDFISAIKKK